MLRFTQSLLSCNVTSSTHPRNEKKKKVAIIRQSPFSLIERLSKFILLHQYKIAWTQTFVTNLLSWGLFVLESDTFSLSQMFYQHKIPSWLDTSLLWPWELNYVYHVTSFLLQKSFHLCVSYLFITVIIKMDMDLKMGHAKRKYSRKDAPRHNQNPYIFIFHWGQWSYSDLSNSFHGS